MLRFGIERIVFRFDAEQVSAGCHVIERDSVGARLHRYPRTVVDRIHIGDALGIEELHDGELHAERVMLVGQVEAAGIHHRSLYDPFSSRQGIAVDILVVDIKPGEVYGRGGDYVLDFRMIEIS